MVEKENYVVVQGWMITELGLKGNELLIYAVIHGFSQVPNQAFTGSLQYLADWINGSKQTVINCLKSLIDKDLIIKIEKTYNGVKFFEYQSKIFNRGQNFLPNNIEKENIIINNNIKESDKSKRFVPPTLEEVKAYCKERNNNVDPVEFMAHYTATNWYRGKTKISNWRACVITWEKNARAKQQQQQQIKKGQPSSTDYLDYAN